MRTSRPSPNQCQRGAAAVEFAIVCLLFFTILFAILEFGRMLYLYNTMQEVTRRGARAAVVRWVDQRDAIKSIAMFGGAAIPAGAEVRATNITIEYMNKAGEVVSVANLPSDPGDNLSACGDISRTAACIYSVRVSIVDVSYRPMVSLFSFLNVRLPRSAVTMHAESLGFEL